MVSYKEKKFTCTIEGFEIIIDGESNGTHVTELETDHVKDFFFSSFLIFFVVVVGDIWYDGMCNSVGLFTQKLNRLS